MPKRNGRLSAGTTRPSTFRRSETARAGTEGCPHDARADETAQNPPPLSLVRAQADTGDSHFASVMPDRSGRHPDESRAAALQVALDAEALDAGCSRAFQYNADEDDGRASMQLGARQRRTCSGCGGCRARVSCEYSRSRSRSREECQTMHTHCEFTTISRPPGDSPLLVRWCPMWQWSTHLPFGSVKTTS